VNGARPEADWFADAWRPGTGCTLRTAMQLRLHALTCVDRVPAPDGRMRSATTADEPVLRGWMAAFAREAGIQGGDEQHAATIRARASEPLGLVVWEDGSRPAAFAGSTWTSPAIARVGPVYTPPEMRRRGYAMALVAAFAQALLDTGARRCLLYTDLANPTSNAIYGGIGYRPQLDAVEIDFVARDG